MKGVFKSRIPAGRNKVDIIYWPLPACVDLGFMKEISISSNRDRVITKMTIIGTTKNFTMK